MWLRLIAYLFFILSCFSYGLLWLKAKPNYKIGMGIGKRGARNLGPLALASGVSMSECECVSADRFRLINITFQFRFMIRRFARTMEWPQAHNTLPHKHIDTDSSSARSCAPSVRTGALWLLLSLCCCCCCSLDGGLQKQFVCLVSNFMLSFESQSGSWVWCFVRPGLCVSNI